VSKIKLEKNTNERAIVRLKIPTKVIEDEIDTYDNDGNLEKRVVEKIVEIEFDDKALLIPARVDALPYAI